MAPQTVWLEVLTQERVLVMAHGTDVHDEHWETYVRAARTAAAAPVEVRNLVYAGGPLSKKHADQLVHAVHGSDFRTAIVSPSTATRFVVSAFGLVNRNVRCFAPDQLGGALDFIGVSGSERAVVEATFHRLCEQVRVSS